MSVPQPGIFAPIPSFSRYLEFRAVPDPDLVPLLRDLVSRSIDQDLVVGVGPGFSRAVVVHSGFTERTVRPFSRSAHHESESLSQTYEDRVTPFELWTIQILEDRNDPFDREPGALKNT